MNDAPRFHHALRAAAFASLAGVVVLSIAGCKNHAEAAQVVASNGQDPAAANLAQPYTGGSAGGYTTGGSAAKTQVLGQSQTYNPQTTAENYDTQEPAPIIRQAPQSSSGAPTQYYPVPQAGTGQASYNGDPNAQQDAYSQPQSYNDAEEAGEQALAETDQAPPPLPEYDQPAAPADDYIWNPGYWNYASTGYYWVPGIWCAPPFAGALWTPPYWAYDNRHYRFHRGYWGPHVGYYGGVNYGFGYVGYGYYGGYWRGRDFYYNRAVTNVNIEHVHNVYQRTVILNGESYGPRPNNRISYNGGPGGLRVQPRPEELGAMQEAHYAPLPAQRDNRLAAATNRSQFFDVNRGQPAQAFGTRALGSASNIPAAPGPQGFSRQGEQTFAGSQRSAQPTSDQRPGELNRPGANAAQAPLYGRLGEPGRPTDGNAQSGGSYRSGLPTQALYNTQLRPTTPNQPSVNYGRPGQFDRPAAPGQPVVNYRRPDNFNQSVAPNQPGVNYRRPGDFNQSTTPNQPGVNYGRPSQFDRPAAPNQPVVNYRRPGDFNQSAASTQPGVDTGRPAGRPDRPVGANQPGFNGGRPVAAQPTAPLQPAYGQQENLNRPGGTSTPNYPSGFRRDPNQPGASYPIDRGQPRTNYARPSPATQGYEAQRPTQPQAQPQSQPQGQPNFQERRSFQPQPQPNFQEPRLTQPQAQPQGRPNFPEQRPEQRPSPTFERAPQAASPRPAAPPQPAQHAEAPQQHPAAAVNNGRPH